MFVFKRREQQQVLFIVWRRTVFFVNLISNRIFVLVLFWNFSKFETIHRCLSLSIEIGVEWGFVVDLFLLLMLTMLMSVVKFFLFIFIKIFFIFVDFSCYLFFCCTLFNVCVCVYSLVLWILLDKEEKEGRKTINFIYKKTALEYFCFYFLCHFLAFPFFSGVLCCILLSFS